MLSHLDLHGKLSSPLPHGYHYHMVTDLTGNGLDINTKTLEKGQICKKKLLEKNRITFKTYPINNIKLKKYKKYYINFKNNGNRLDNE